jgi:predicted HicB family RNase H-like nuclease
MENNFVEKYAYKVEWSQDDGVHIGYCLEFPSLAAHGKSMTKALNEIKKVVEETILWLKETKEPIPEPFSIKKFKGNLTLRVPAQVHRDLIIKSAQEGISVNQYILSKIS